MKKNFHASYRPDIDGLRAIAILSVVVFHISPDWLQGGFVGVDIFFVISGFLISNIIFKSLQSGQFSFKEFYRHRIRRIFPALTLVLISCALYGWFRLMPAEYKQLGRHLVSSAAFFQNFRLKNESGYFDTESDLKPLLHLWSLSIEEQFYLLFPLIIWGAWRLNNNRLLTLVVLAGASFALNVRAVHGDAVGAFFLPQMRFWELLSGAILAYFSGRDRETPVLPSNVDAKAGVGVGRGASAHRCSLDRVLMACPDGLSVLGVLLLIASVVLIRKQMTFPGWIALAPVLGSLLVIRAGPEAWLNRVWLSAPPMVWVGLISYPLYLWHWPLIAFAKIEWGESLPPEVRWGVVLAGFLLAWLTYQFVESPIRSGRKGRVVTSLLLTTAFAVLLPGLLITGYQGLGFRYPGLIPDLQAGQLKFPVEWRGGTCGLDRAQDFDAFGKECFGADPANTATATHKRSLLLWGDSYATHLYPGLQHVLSNQYEIAQLTTYACPPILGFVHKQRSHCAHINQSILSHLQNQGYDTVMMAANWQGVGIEGLAATLDELKRLARARIILVGPPPRWTKGLPRALFEVYLRDPAHPLPDRLAQGFSERTTILDAELETLARSKGIDYVSAWRGLCNAEGCLALDRDAIVAFDQGHLTSSGSRRLISAVRKEIDSLN